MRKIVMQCGLVGEGIVAEKGDVVELPAVEADRLIKRGSARPYDEETHSRSGKK